MSIERVNALPTGHPERMRPADPDPAADGGPRASSGTALRQVLPVVLASALLPGLGHVLLGRRRTGGAILAVVGLGALAATVVVVRTERAELLSALVSGPVLVAVTAGCVVLAIGWAATIVHTYVLTRPGTLPAPQRLVGAAVVIALCTAVTVPLGVAADLAHTQRTLLDDVFAPPAAAPPRPSPTTAAEPAARFPHRRLSVLLLGSDAGPDRTGTRTDTMIVASMDTRTAETILIALPRNIQRAPFPAGSAMARRFPDGFRDPARPLSGDHLLNAVYGYGHANPAVAPPGPTDDPGVNLLMSTIEEMLGLRLDHYVAVDMDGLAAIVDALGGVTVDVGPVRLPIGGVTPSGRRVQPDGYLEPGVQHLDGHQALWFARSRRDSDDYDRMTRQRELITALLAQNSPAELLTRFRAVAVAARDGITTDIPRSLLPALVSLLDEHGMPQPRTLSFDPNLPDPSSPDGGFRPARPDVGYMRRTVREAISDAAPDSGPAKTGARTPGDG